jgi:hypothetical protein
MTRALIVAVSALVLSTGAARPATTFFPSPGHRIAGFALDRESLVLAEDPLAETGCPRVRIVAVTGGLPRTLTPPGGPTCRFGGTFAVRKGRAVGVALVRGIWVVQHRGRALVVKGSRAEQESVLARGPANELGPVVATNWLRLYARGDGVVSGNRRELWSSTVAVTSLGLDDLEHAVSVDANGGIAMWHPHGARYGSAADARAKAAATDGDLVAVLRRDRARLDVRRLSGARVSSWPIAPGAAPLLDVEGGVAVYVAGRSVHELLLATGVDRVVATAPPGTTLLDAQIERSLVAYAYRGGPAGAGRVVVIRR